MAERYPMWWIHRGENREPDSMPSSQPQEILRNLLERVRSGDKETLLLLWLLVLLWQEDADKKLLLALAYILL